MKDKLFALGSYEIELQDNQEIKYMLDSFVNIADYIDTAVDYNNDYIFNSIRFKSSEKYKIISKMSFCHYSNYEFFVSNHLKCLGRDFIDIMLIHSNRGDWIDLAKKINRDERFKEVGVSNFTKEDIIKYKEEIGSFPAYNEVEINPYYLDIDTIDYCRENGIKIIAYAILGGKYNSWKNVSDFSLPYLVSYAAAFSDIIIIRPNSIRETNEFLDTINNYKPDIDIEPITFDKKAIEPMIYKLPKITRRYLGELTYSTACGKNTGELVGKVLNVNLPDMEMLGDYKTYIRYLYRQKYTGNDAVYDYDFLISDEGKYISVYLYDNDEKLTKVNINSKVEVKEYEI